jgi:hypothetical protein
MAGQEYKFGGISTIETENQKTELIATRTIFAGKIWNVLEGERQVGAQFSTVAGKSISQITGQYTVLSPGLIELSTATRLNAVAADMTLWGVASMKIDSLKVAITSTYSTIAGGIIKIG